MTFKPLVRASRFLAVPLAVSVLTLASALAAGPVSADPSAAPRTGPGGGPDAADVTQLADATQLARAATQSAALPASPSANVRSLADVKRVLSPADTHLYEEIFALQEKGHWKRADKKIALLSDRLLMGHVLAQRYLHPTKYRSRYKELKAWMAAYSDHPQAGRIYKLALKRRPGNWRRPDRPEPLLAIPRFSDDHEADTVRPSVPRKRLSKSDRRKARALKNRIRKTLGRGHTLIGKRLLQEKETRRLLSSAEQDVLRARLALGYLYDRRPEWSYNWASKAAKRSGKVIAEPHWAAGLAAWRLGRFEKAAEHFTGAADTGFTDPWLDSAAAFWAARALLVTRQPKEVNRYLRQAARHARTFYGLIAAHVLGTPVSYDWSSPPFETNTVRDMVASGRGKRALALVQVGRHREAERELRRLAGAADKVRAQNILALADASGMASLAVRLSDHLFPDGGGYDGAAYPIPAWTPRDGFRIDRALIYALIRQESKFNPKAKSWAGARGLMQLMPGTASYVAQDRSLRGGHRGKLYDPGFNLKLGQRYIEILLKEQHIKGDLLLLAAAWNGGPGNLNRWRRRVDYAADPLMFIETIPSRETRHFVEHVLANLWVYRDRLGQPKPSLEALARGQWPVYESLGQGRVQVAFFDGQN